MNYIKQKEKKGEALSNDLIMDMLWSFVRNTNEGRCPTGIHDGYRTGFRSAQSRIRAILKKGNIQK